MRGRIAVLFDTECSDYGPESGDPLLCCLSLQQKKHLVQNQKDLEEYVSRVEVFDVSTGIAQWQ